MGLSFFFRVPYFFEKEPKLAESASKVSYVRPFFGGFLCCLQFEVDYALLEGNCSFILFKYFIQV